MTRNAYATAKTQNGRNKRPFLLTHGCADNYRATRLSFSISAYAL
jgi:hypothetical protein